MALSTGTSQCACFRNDNSAILTKALELGTLIQKIITSDLSKSTRKMEECMDMYTYRSMAVTRDLKPVIIHSLSSIPNSVFQSSLHGYTTLRSRVVEEVLYVAASKYCSSVRLFTLSNIHITNTQWHNRGEKHNQEYNIFVLDCDAMLSNFLLLFYLVVCFP